MKTYSMTLYVERGDDELELEISGTVSSYVAAVTHRLPEDCHPAEGGEVEIESVKLNGVVWDGELSEEERERAEAGLSEAAGDDDDDGGDPNEDYFDDDLEEVVDYPEHF